MQRTTSGLAALATALGCVVPLSLGCGTASQNQAEQTFEEQTRAFHMHMRWGRYREAATFVEDSDRGAFIGYYLHRGDDYQITEYEIENVDYDTDTSTATMIVWVQSFQLPSTMVDEVVIEEQWVYNPDRRVWEVIEREEIED